MILFYQIFGSIILLVGIAVGIRLFLNVRRHKKNLENFEKLIQREKQKSDELNARLIKKFGSDLMNRDIDSIYDDEIEKHYSK